MAKVLTDSTNYSNIADNIRFCTGGTTKKYKPSQMAEAVLNVYDRGKEDGWDDGYTFGVDKGHQMGYEAGFSDGRDVGVDVGRDVATSDFWDNVQNYGNRTGYNSAFTNWGSEYIRPKYKVELTADSSVQSAGIVFEYCKKLKKVESAYFDFSQKPTGTSNNAGYYYTFNGCTSLEEIEDIGLVPQYSYTNTFAYCYKLHTIAKMGVDENTKFSNTFTGCEDLVNLTIDGTIGQNGFNVSACTLLSADSIKSIIEALSITLSGLSITLPSTAQDTYDAEYGEGAFETLIMPYSNWSIVW